MSLKTDFNTPGTTDAILHSPDGLLWADRVELDLIEHSAAFFNGSRFLGTIRHVGDLPPGSKIIVSISAGFRIRPA